MSSGTIDVGSDYGPWRYYRQWSGTNDPAHKADNPYTLNVTASRGTASKDCRYPSNPPQYYAQCGDFSALPDPYGPNDSLALLGRLASNIKGHRFNFAVFVGEFRETSRMVLGSLDTLITSVRRLRRGDFGGAIRSLGSSVQGRATAARRFQVGDLAGTWLALQYGWRPLISDVHSATVAYAKLRSPPLTARVSASLKRESSGDSSTSPTNWTCSATRSYSQRYVVTLKEQLSVQRSLGLLDPSLVAWELVPLSFVADWFLPIGEFLEASSVLNAVKLEKWVLTTKESKSGKVSKILNTGIYCKDGFYRENQIFRFVRQVGTTPLSVPPPRIQGLSHLRQLASAAALIFQRSNTLRTNLNALR